MPYTRIILFLCCLWPINIFATPILVETSWLASQLGNKNVAIIDMSDSMQYSRFHIPGARHLPYNAINQITRKQVSLSIGSQNIAKVMTQLGIRADMHIVLYDDIGGLNASRLFWELERLGHQKLSILDGGLVKWILEGRKVVARHTTYPKTTYRPSLKNGHDNLATLNEISADKPDRVLLDVRSREEYTGHPRQKISGHIPGAKWWHWEDNVNFEKSFQIKSKSELENRLSGLGLNNKQQDIIVYCRSGHRASHSYFILRQLGFTKVRLYDGSMAEFSQYKPTSLKKGPQP